MSTTFCLFLTLLQKHAASSGPRQQGASCTARLCSVNLLWQFGLLLVKKKPLVSKDLWEIGSIFKFGRVTDHFYHLLLLKSGNKWKSPEKLLVLMKICTTEIWATFTPNPIILVWWRTFFFSFFVCFNFSPYVIGRSPLSQLHTKDRPLKIDRVHHCFHGVKGIILPCLFKIDLRFF